MDTDVTKGARLRVALVCGPEVLRLGTERMLAQDATLKVLARRRLDAVRAPVDVAVLAERRLGDAPAACEAAARQLDAGVVLVATRPDPHVVLDCLAQGATGFVAEGDGPQHLRAAIARAAAGEYHVGPQVLTSLLDSQRSERRRPHSSEEAERGLLALLAGGRTTAEIATMLGIAPKTVRNRASLLYRRLGVRSRAEAVRVADARGLLDRAG